MSVKFTEKELDVLLKNGKISLSDNSVQTNNEKVKLNNDKGKISKISLTEKNELVNKKSSSSVNINKVIQNTKSSIIKYSISDTHISIIFEEAILLSINQIFSFLQREKQQHFFFMYKKTWHNKVEEALKLIKSETKSLPFFDKDIEITLFRQAPREIDKDAITTMFKFIIDGLKRTNNNPLGILDDDNPKVVHTIKFHNEKGTHLVGIKIKLIKNDTAIMTKENFLKY